MPIDATTSTQSIAATQAAQTSAVNQAASKTTDTSFKDEMTKVSESEQKETKTDTKKEQAAGTLKKETAKAETKQDSKTNNNTKNEVKNENKLQANKKDNDIMQTSLEFNQMALNNANNLLSNDIAQVIETNLNTENLAKNQIWSLNFGETSKTAIKMNETDAEFFINLTQNNEVSIDAITVQAQNMINNGADIKEISQNFKVSQTLLNALNESRQNNQPIRIDFDQNISVILRVGKDGAISANFIPGDKAVEQYLRNNIDSLKNAFDEQELDYAELTYSNSSKEQNQRRREENKEK